MKYFIRLGLFLFFLLQLFYVNAQELTVEPPHWWYDMEVDTVQLMLHGQGISSLNASLDKKTNAKITRQTKLVSDNYLLLTLDLSGVKTANTIEICLKKKRKKVHSFTYEILQKPDLRLASGFDNSDAIYLITPDRFANADHENDDIIGFKEISNRSYPGGRHGGDLLGIKNHIDYIADMGFTAIWLNPIIENDNPEYSYHGYAATNFYKVDARFGTNEEYKTFVSTCHAKGIKVIMDMIHNHCSIEHPWIADLPAEDWLNTWDQYTETNHKKSTLQDVHAAEIDKETYVNGWFVPSMPDLNQRNPHLETYLVQNAIWWSLFLKLDGIRMDTYSYPDKDYMQKWVTAMNREVPSVSMVGEEWSINPAHIAYWQKGKINSDGFKSDLEYLMDFPTNQILDEALIEPEGWNTGLVKLYESIANDFIYPHPENLFIFLDNHDMVRSFTNFQENIDLMKSALTFCLTTRGIPQVYYGTEILMTSPPQRDDGRIRTDYPGGWTGDQVNAFTGQGLTTDQLDFRTFLTNLLHIRKSETVLQTGELTHYSPKDGVYVYFRHNAEDRIMVIINKNKEPYALDMNRFEQFIAQANLVGEDLISKQKIKLDEQLSLDPARSYIIKIPK